MGFGIIEKIGFFFDTAKQAAEDDQPEGANPQYLQWLRQGAGETEEPQEPSQPEPEGPDPQYLQWLRQGAGAESASSQRIEGLRAKLVRHQSFYDRIPAFETQRLSQDRRGELYNDIREHIIVVTGFINRELRDDPEVAVVRQEAEALKIKLQERLVDLYRYMLGSYNNEERLAGWIDDVDRLPFSELPLTDEQREEIKDYIGERIAEIQAIETTAASGTQGPHGHEGDEEPALWGEQGVIVFIQRDPEAESQAISDIEGWWNDMNTFSQQMMASYLQVRASCENRDERREVQEVMDQFRGSAGAAVETSHEVVERVPLEVLRENSLFLPAEQNIIELPNGARICDESSEAGSAVTFVYLDELDAAQPPRDMEEFTGSIMNVVAENYARFIGYMRTIGSGYPDSFEIELQFYMTEEGRIRTIAATYDDEDREYDLPPPDPLNPPLNPPQPPAQLRTERITENISKGIAAPANMQYYRIKMEISVLDDNRINVNMLPF